MTVPETPTAVFVRGAVNQDGMLDISECIYLLRDLFLEGAEIPCEDAVDVNDDGQLDMDDVNAVCFPWGPLGPVPPVDLAPLECGPDATPDRLGCAWSPSRQ